MKGSQWTAAEALPSTVTPEILERLGYKVVRFNCKYDGMFRERNPEPYDANLEKLKKLVLSEKADMGVAHEWRRRQDRVHR